MSKKLISVLLLIAVMASALSAGASAAYVGGSYVAGQGLFIMDYDTGVELYGSNADTAFVPASITKLMSMYLTYEAIENGEISADTVVPISDRVRRLSVNTSYWNTVPLYQNQTYYVSELMELIFVYSASASVVALAELICGDEASFVARMNEKADEWGIDATFNGCSGIEDNYITPRAVAELSRRLISDYPQVLELTSKTSTTFHGTTYNSTNHLLTSQYYEGVDGLKSGTTTNAGYCFVATAERNGVRIITVVMKSTSGEQRFYDSKALLDYGFSVRDSVVRDATMRLDPYTDVYTDNWFADGVSYVGEAGLMTGVSATLFAPQGELSRAMAAAVLYRLSGSPETAATDAFSDVSEDDWFASAVSWCAENGVVEGYEDGSFGADDSVTRAELAAMLYRYAAFVGRDTSASAGLSDFSDGDEIAEWAAPALAWCVAEGIINGVAGALEPTGTTTRAQCAVMLQRYCTAAAE